MDDHYNSVYCIRTHWKVNVKELYMENDSTHAFWSFDIFIIGLFGHFNKTTICIQQSKISLLIVLYCFLVYLC